MPYILIKRNLMQTTQYNSVSLIHYIRELLYKYHN
jgi:hypothetical protein